MQKFFMDPTLAVSAQFEAIIRAAFPDEDRLGFRHLDVDIQGVNLRASRPTYDAYTNKRDELVGISMSVSQGFRVVLRLAVNVRGKGDKSATTPYIDLEALRKKFLTLAQIAGEIKIVEQERETIRTKTTTLGLSIQLVFNDAETPMRVDPDYQGGGIAVEVGVRVTSPEQARDLAALVATWREA